jgi:hypothetical protein
MGAWLSRKLCRELECPERPVAAEIHQEIDYHAGATHVLAYRSKTIPADDSRNDLTTNGQHIGPSDWVVNGGWVIIGAGVCLVLLVACWAFAGRGAKSRRPRRGMTWPRVIGNDLENLTRRAPSGRRSKATMRKVSENSKGNSSGGGSGRGSNAWVAPPAYAAEDGWENIELKGIGDTVTKPDPVAPKYIYGGKYFGGRT